MTVERQRCSVQELSLWRRPLVPGIPGMMVAVRSLSGKLASSASPLPHMNGSIIAAGTCSWHQRALSCSRLDCLAHQASSRGPRLRPMLPSLVSGPALSNLEWAGNQVALRLTDPRLARRRGCLRTDVLLLRTAQCFRCRDQPGPMIDCPGWLCLQATPSGASIFPIVPKELTPCRYRLQFPSIGRWYRIHDAPGHESSP